MKLPPLNRAAPSLIFKLSFRIFLLGLFFSNTSKMFGKCHELSLANYEMLSSYSKSELENFAKKNGYKTTPYVEGIRFYCAGIISFAVSNNGKVLLLGRSEGSKKNLTQAITSRGYLKSKTYADGSLVYDNGMFYIFILPDKANKGKYNISIEPGYEDDESQSNAKVIAKKLSNNRLLVDSYTNATDISVEKGDRVSISAFGSIVIGAWAGSSGPDDISGFNSYSCFSDFRHVSLLVKIGNGEWQKAGSSKSFIAQTSGVLQLGINDCDRENNSGSFTIKYNISRYK